MTSLTKFYQVTQIILYIWSYDQSLVTLAFQWEKIIATSVLWGFDQLKHFCHGCPWFRFNNVGLGLGMAFTFCTIVKKNVETRSFKGTNSYLCRSCREKAGSGGRVSLPASKRKPLVAASVYGVIQTWYTKNVPLFSCFQLFLQLFEIPRNPSLV